jgi:hypothetical protein
MTAEWVHPGKVVIHQDERTWLRGMLTPPVGWKIWIGSYSGVYWRELSIQQHAAKLRFTTVDDGKATEHNLVFTIIGMRHLMIVVASSSWPRMHEIIEALGSPHPALVQIWPLIDERIVWPQVFSVTDGDADIMATYYLGKIRGSPV